MIVYVETTQQLMTKFVECEIHQVPRIDNDMVDALANFASTMPSISRQVCMDTISQPTVGCKAVYSIWDTMEDLVDWTTPIQKYLHDGILLEDGK